MPTWRLRQQTRQRPTRAGTISAKFRAVPAEKILAPDPVLTKRRVRGIIITTTTIIITDITTIVMVPTQHLVSSNSFSNSLSRPEEMKSLQEESALMTCRRPFKLWPRPTAATWTTITTATKLWRCRRRVARGSLLCLETCLPGAALNAVFIIWPGLEVGSLQRQLTAAKATTQSLTTAHPSARSLPGTGVIAWEVAGEPNLNYFLLHIRTIMIQITKIWSS